LQQELTPFTNLCAVEKVRVIRKCRAKPALFARGSDILERVRFAAVIKNNQKRGNPEKIVAMCVFGA
jgi:hypothetical protein